MLASYSVKDSMGNTAGYIIDGRFYTDYTAKENIIYISNLIVSRNLIDKGIVAKVTKGGHGDKFDTIPVYKVGSRFPY